MLSTIKIGTEEQDLRTADPSWITNQITRRRQDGENVCVRVEIHEGDCNVNLATPTCGGGGVGRRAVGCEIEVIELWNKLGLNEHDFSPGNVVAFSKQIWRLL